ncbi:MAG: hypothetical protein EBR23_12335, partial [Planctomycetia bacterium]|nr:hypothetical protein [Planctomycetia bacterium]
ALANASDLQAYTYSVAGCVGEFWTRITRAHLFPVAPLDDAKLLHDGVRFGQGLQLVNILRDLPRDLRQGRCYLPLDRLRAIGRLQGQVPFGGAEQAAQTQFPLHGIGGGLGQHLVTTAARRPRGHAVASPVAGVDRRQRRVGDILAARLEVPPLIFLGLLPHPETAPQHDIEPWQGLITMRDRRLAEHVTGDVLPWPRA